MRRSRIQTRILMTQTAVRRCCLSCVSPILVNQLERLLQYLDDLDDLVGALGLLAEKLRNIAGFAAITCLLLGIEAAGILLALREPPLGLATAILLFITLLYRAVTRPNLEISR